MSNNIDWTTVHHNDLYTDSDDDSTTADAKLAEKARRAQELRIEREQFKEERRKMRAEERERQRLFEEKRKKEQEQAAATEERRVEQEAAAVTKAQASAPAAVTVEEYKAHPGSQKVTACVPCPVPRKKRSRSDAKEGSEEGGPKAGRRWRRAQAGLLKVAPKKRARTASMTDVSGASALDNESGDDEEEEEEEVVPDELFEGAKNDSVEKLTGVLLMLVKKCDEWIELERENIDFQREKLEVIKKLEREMNQMADVQREQLEEMEKFRVTQERFVVLLRQARGEDPKSLKGPEASWKEMEVQVVAGVGT